MGPKNDHDFVERARVIYTNLTYLHITLSINLAAMVFFRPGVHFVIFPPKYSQTQAGHLEKENGFPPEPAITKCCRRMQFRHSRLKGEFPQPYGSCARDTPNEVK